MNTRFPQNTEFAALEYEQALSDLEQSKTKWAQTDVPTRIELLRTIKDDTMQVAEEWAELANKAKGIPEDATFAGEEWFTGPFAFEQACTEMIHALSNLEGHGYIDRLRKRTRHNDQLAVQVMPMNLWDALLYSGYRAEVWMQDGVRADNLKDHVAQIYKTPEAEREGRLSLVLGAGNVAAIPALDVLHKLFAENEVVLLKLNPVNDYLYEPFSVALKSLIDLGALRIVKGDGAVGAWLTNHPLVENIHITGAGETHDLIVWGKGAGATKRKKANKPKNPKPITSELGAVTPTIVVPGPWSAADFKHQAQALAVQKLINSGFACVASQVMILPENWEGSEKLLTTFKDEVSKNHRPAYYPGAIDRMARFKKYSKNLSEIDRGDTPALIINELADGPIFSEEEFFAPVLSTHRMKAETAEQYLINAIKFANKNLYGTLSANIIIHPKTIQEIGRARFDEILTDFHYGAIGVNAWTGVSFLLTRLSWGAFPGHTLNDVGSGIGTVHNTYMFDKPERTVLMAPFYPFPRGLLHGQLSIMPKPPWFLRHRRQKKTAMWMTRFWHRPSILKLLAVFRHALRS